ncbi:MAG TPA: glycosyltransferase family 4 protein [Vicinamibacterales bacterium]|nr:glycosyltransferase family 4 protein [Vicinamibacterales bacterium]
MSGPPESVVFVSPGVMGGVISIIANLLAYREPDAFTYHVVLTDEARSADARFTGRLPADTQRVVRVSLGIENIHALIRRVRRALPPGGGVLVTNDLVELATVSALDVNRTVMMLIHGDDPYYYDLAVRHEDVIDVFICYGQVMFDTLRQRLPGRHGSIVHLPYGIPLPARTRTAARGPLRLLYAGRLDHGHKGVLDLPAIDAALSATGTPVSWTIVGGGPDDAELRARWNGAAHVRWLGVMANAEVIEEAARHDVFVLPTRTEGVPVAMIEAMGAGLVPVVSDIPSGVRELVDPGVHGITPPVGDIAAFADAIRALHSDRDRLETMSAAARERVVARYNVRERVRAYQQLFARHHELRRPRPPRTRLRYGSRLDRPWIPNAAVKAIRSLARRAR